MKAAFSFAWLSWDSGQYLNLYDTTVITNHLLYTSDNPLLDFTKWAWFTASGDMVDRSELLMMHTIFLAVRVKGDDVNQSSTTYPQRAKLTWYFNGYGTIDESLGGIWTSLQGASSVSGDPQFVEVTNGEVVPNLEKSTNFKDLTEQWMMKNL